MQSFEKTIHEHLTERAWDNLRPGDVAKSISIEAAELLEIFQWVNPTLEEVKADPKKLEKIKKELADVMIYCFEMSVLLGLDTRAILLEKLAHAQEKYPAHLFKNRDGSVEPGSEEIYWQIKEEYRRKKE